MNKGQDVKGKGFSTGFDPKVFYEHAEVCKVLANPKRLMILYLLSQGDKNVGEIAHALGITVANTSQHLAKLREKELVSTQKKGSSIYYTIKDDRIPRACDLIRASLLDRLKRQARLAQKIESMTNKFVMDKSFKNH